MAYVRQKRPFRRVASSGPAPGSAAGGSQARVGKPALQSYKGGPVLAHSELRQIIPRAGIGCQAGLSGSGMEARRPTGLPLL